MGGSKAYKADCHHLRISVALDEVRSYYKDISGVCVVLHTKGKKSERPHYHIFIKDSCRGDTICERLVKHLSVRPKGQEEWSIRAHDNFENWYNYAMDTMKGGEEIIYNMDVPRPEVKRNLIMETASSDAATGVVTVTMVPTTKKSKSKSQAILFYDYMVNKYVGVKDKITKHRVKYEYYHWSYYGYNDPQAIKNIRTVWYQLNKDYPEVLDAECEGWIARTKIFSDD